MAQAQAAQASTESRYGRIMSRQRSKIEEVTSDIKKRFRAFSSMVLAETCELSVEVDRRSIGQEGTKFDFPYFEVMMTSGSFITAQVPGPIPTPCRSRRGSSLISPSGSPLSARSRKARRSRVRACHGPMASKAQRCS